MYWASFLFLIRVIIGHFSFSQVLLAAGIASAVFGLAVILIEGFAARITTRWSSTGGPARTARPFLTDRGWSVRAEPVVEVANNHQRRIEGVMAEYVDFLIAHDRS